MNTEQYLGKNVKVTLKDGGVFMGEWAYDVWSDGAHLIMCKRGENRKVRRIVSDSEIQSIEVVE